MDNVTIEVLFGLVGMFAAIFAGLLTLLNKVIPSRAERAMGMMCDHIRDIRKLGLESVIAQVNALFQCHLGNGTHDENGRLKWWFPSEALAALKNMEELLRDVVKELRLINGRK